MSGPYVNFEDTRIQLANGHSMIFFHTGDLTVVQQALSEFEAKYGPISYGDGIVPDNGGDVYSIEVTSDNTQVHTHAKLVNNGDQFHAQYNAKTLAFDDGSFVAAWSQSQGGGQFAVCYQRFDENGNPLGQNVIMPTLDDPVDTHSLSRAGEEGGNAFNILIGRTNETFTVDSQSPSNSSSSSQGVEKTVLGSESDIFYGSANDDDVQTGGGDDRIYTGAGDDVIVVQGEKISATPHAAHSTQTFNVRVQDGVYYLDGVQQKSLNFVPGETYRFDVSDQSNSMHPMQFSTDYDGHHAYGGYNQYYGLERFGWDSYGAEGTPDAYVEFTVPTDFSDYASEVFYYCNNHPGMGGTASVGQPGAAITEGSDTVVDAGSGADVVVVEGQGDASVDVGADTDADTVRVDSSFAGTLLIKNAGTSDTVEIMRDTGTWSVDEEGTIVIQMGDQDTITIENYLSYDEIQDMYVSTGPVITATGYTPVDLGFGDLSLVSVRGSNYTDDLLYSPSYNAAAEEGVFYNASGWDGDDVIYGGGGTQQLLGGEGTDTFHLSSDGQSTLIVGDRESSAGRTQAAKEGDLPSVSSINTDFGDAVYLGWLKSEITLSEQGSGHFRIEHAGTGSVIDLYDVEELYFSDGEYKALTEGRVIGGGDWIGEAAGMDIEYEQHNVSFQVDGNTLKVLASATVEVTEELFETYSVWDYFGTEYSGLDYPGISPAEWESYGATLLREEQMSMGVQTFEKELDGVVIWEGPRSEVDAFEFADGVSINVINVSSEDIAGDPVFDTIGTEGIDLIFGSAGDDLIDGKGGDDIIFGGDGDDVIIGGEGDDVIIGGDGADILRGDGVDGNDAAVATWKAAASGFNSANPDNAIVFDENMLSLDNGGPLAGDGDDVIIGGDGLDDIKSGDGKNFVTSGKADIDGDGQANLDLINQNIEDHQYLLDDEDWV